MQPTRAGKQTYEFAKPVLGSVNDLKTAVVHNGETTGDFRFGVSRALGDTALTRSISLLRAAYPKLKIQAFAQWSDTLVERLQNRSLDAAVVVLPDGGVPPANLIGERIGTQTVDVVAPKSLRLPEPATLEQLSSHSWILNPRSCAGAQAIGTAMLQRGLPLVVAIEAEGNDLQLSLVSQGVGLGLVVSRILRASPFRKSVKVIKVRDFSPKQGVWVLHSQQLGRLAPAVQCLSNAVKGQLLSHRSLK